MTPMDYMKILKRRKWSLVLPALIVFLIAVVVALVLPSIYMSTSTILIEEQDIPADFVMATVTSYVEQRLQSINQRMMSFTKLSEIIQQLNLYPELRDKRTAEEIVEKMIEEVFEYKNEYDECVYDLNMMALNPSYRWHIHMRNCGICGYKKCIEGFRGYMGGNYCYACNDPVGRLKGHWQRI